MKRRNFKGGALILSTVCSLVLAIFGLGLFYLSRLMGGGVEVSNAVDAGNLNLAKVIVRYPGVDLTAEEMVEFGDCLDLQTGQVNLLTINDVVLHTLQVAADAELSATPGDNDSLRKKRRKRRTESDPSALKRARAIVDMCNAICARLKQRLIDFDKPGPLGTTDSDSSANSVDADDEEDVDIAPDDQEGMVQTGDDSVDDDDLQDSEESDLPVEVGDAFQVFLSVANENSLRMLGDTKSTSLDGLKYEWSYMNTGGASNAIVDDFDFPGRSAATTVKLADGHTYLRGYVNIPVLGTSIQAVPVQPDQLPHLVSTREFHDSSSEPAKFAPPNAFGVSAVAGVKNGIKTGASSFGIVGTKLAHAIRLGNYIRVVNPPGSENKLNALPSTDNIFNAELRKGIFLIADQSGTAIAFTTNKNLLGDWLRFNQTQRERPESGVGIFSIKGEPASAVVLQAMHSVILECDLKSVSGLNTNSLSVSLQPAFMRAYPHLAEPTPVESSDLMALETVKEDIIAEYDRITTAAASGQPVSIDGFVQCAELTVPAATGLRTYRRNKFTTFPTVPFSNLERKSASVRKLLGRQSRNIRKDLKKAVVNMFENPDLTKKVKGVRIGRRGGGLRKRTVSRWIELDLKDILKSMKIADLDTTYYIYENPRFQYRLTFSETPPVGSTPNIKARGNITRFIVRERKIKSNVDLLRGGEFRKDGLLFGQTLGTKIVCKEIGQWTTSSGINGNYGDLELRNEIELNFNGQESPKAFLGL